MSAVNVGAAGSAAAASGGPIGMVAHTFTTTTVDIGKGNVTATGGMRINSNGDLEAIGGSVSVNPAIDTAVEWLRAGTPGDYEVRLTNTAGSDVNAGTPGTSGVWYRCNSTRDFFQSVTGSTGASRSGTFTVDFRSFSSGLLVKSIPGVVITAQVV